MKHNLIERLHQVGNNYWVYYELMGKPLADFPDDGKPVVMEIVKRIREEFHIGLSEAYTIWKQREVE